MKPLSFAAVLGAAAVLAGLPVLGTAAAPANNTITLRSYEISDFSGNNEVSSSGQGHVRVSFRNDGDMAATAVIFDVLNDGEYAGHIDDFGTFSKGVTITHQFHWVNVHQGESLRIAQVRYADGTIWSTDGTLPPALRRQAR